MAEAPAFWWEKPGWRALALAPASWAYGWVAARRMERARRERIDAPVVCIGNLTVGGSGKTPVAIALGREATRLGLKPGFLSRGHGGGVSAPHLVDPARDGAGLLGDEPLLLAAHAPVAVTPDRAAGARLLLRQGCDFLVMDDGFQSARIHIDHAAIVVDARYGIGNGKVLPAGPMRAPLTPQLRFADSVIKMGEGSAADAVVRAAARAGRPVYEAEMRPIGAKELAGKRFLAFAGIGHPEKFFDTIAAAGGVVALTRPFPDHHPYRDEELGELAASARDAGLDLITTAKDAARLRHGSPLARALLRQARVLEVEVAFDLAHIPGRIVEEAVEAWRRREKR